MRVALPPLRPNGHTPPPTQVFAITGMCQRPNFRLGARTGDDTCVLDMGDEPYFILRRRSDGGAAIAVLRVEWEGVFTVLANDDSSAEALFEELVGPTGPEEVLRQWTAEAESVQFFVELLTA